MLKSYRKYIILIFIIILALLIFTKFFFNENIIKIDSVDNYESSESQLHIINNRLYNNSGDLITITGVNLGQWLVLEGYLWGIGNHSGQTYSENYSDKTIRNKLNIALKNTSINNESFIKEYRDRFITEVDFKYLKDLGVNFVRIPFSAKDFMSFFDDDNLSSESFRYLDRAMNWCEEYEIYCLFDLHTAIKPQSDLPHADSTNGIKNFWDDAILMQKTTEFWVEMAIRYGEFKWLGGFDLLNEPMAPNSIALQNWYTKTIDAIRATGSQSIIFIQPNNISLDIEGVLQSDKGVVYSPHYYGYGGKIKKENQLLLNQKLKYNVPVVIGEVGNWANDWWAKYTDIFGLYFYRKHDIGIMYWNYKDMILKNNESFGLVRGDTSKPYLEFQKVMNGNASLDANYSLKSLFNSFKTVFPTDRPWVVDIIRNIQANAIMNIISSQDDILNDLSIYKTRASHNMDSVILRGAEFVECDKKTVQECLID